jgi:hypothetical protein
MSNIMAAQGLSAAKRRRAGGAGMTPGEFGGSNAKLNASAAQPNPAAPRKITTQDAIHLVNSKIMSVDKLLKTNLKSIGEKLTEQESYLTENTPDLTLINNAFADINARLVKLETLGERLSVVEEKLSIISPESIATSVNRKSETATKSKKANTRKNIEVVPAVETSTKEPPAKGISFSIGDE